ncbi:MAG: hypothetical protein JRM77_07300 [Nitrososphaerota archaeon]|nr:hypothetical protein [Nitrososphaerota archaeon]
MSNRLGLTVTSLAFAILLVASSVVAAQPSNGFAAYKIEAVSPTGQHSFIINETVGPASKAGFSDLVLELINGQQNLTYSKLINSTTGVFPYLSSISTQALHYANGTSLGISANFTVVGAKAVAFHGGQYTLTEYAFSVSGAYGNKSIDANGTIDTFPSSLIYSASILLGNVGAQATLQGTNLQLVQPTVGNPSATAVGAGIGLGGFALAAALFVRRRERKAQVQTEKPPYWVD